MESVAGAGGLPCIMATQTSAADCELIKRFVQVIGDAAVLVFNCVSDGGYENVFRYLSRLREKGAALRVKKHLRIRLGSLALPFEEAAFAAGAGVLDLVRGK